jgi:hypothetical protein
MPFTREKYHPIKQKKVSRWSGRICGDENKKKTITFKTTNSESW